MSMHDAERDLIGAAIIAPELTQQIKLTAGQFGSPQAGAIWQAIGTIHGAGRQPDPLLIVDEASRLGVLVDHGTIVELVGCGMAANADVYADKIRDAATRRDLAQVLSRAQLKLAAGEPVEEVIGDVSLGLGTESPTEREVSKAMTLDEFVGQRLPDTEWVIPGLLAKGDRLVLTGTEGGGKALALDTPIPTPTGWTTMGDLEVDDEVLGMDGRPTRVIFATEVQHDRTCYRVRFSDGATIVADADHRWLTSTLQAREAAAKLRKRGETKPRGTDQRHKMAQPAVVTTEQIRETLHARGGHCLNHAIPTAAPLELPVVDLPIDPYTLGAWLGDGTSLHAEITTHTDDEQILERIREAGYTVTKKPDLYGWAISRREARDRAKLEADQLVAGGMSRRKAEAVVGIGRRDGVSAPILSLREELRTLGVLGNKHIPAEYLRASLEQRLALLQGLMDTDGTISATGSQCEFSVSCQRLAVGVFELVASLGMKPSIKESAAKLNGVEVNRRWRVTFVPTINPFHLQRKRDRYSDPRTARGQLRYITAVEPVESVPVRCIQVDNADHLYLCGKEMIPTHNTMMMRQLGICAAGGRHPLTLDAMEPRRVLYVDCENPMAIMVKTMTKMHHTLRQQGVDFGDRMWVRRFPQGLDLAKATDRLMLHAMCRTFRPDILLIGPAYKLYVGGSGSREEDLARQVTSVLDGLREEFGFCLVLEHHSPHGQAGFERSVRPIGSSLWLRWPEFGYGLRPASDSGDVRKVDFIPWRGSRDQRDWPRQLVQGTSVPWVDARMPGY